MKTTKVFIGLFTVIFILFSCTGHKVKTNNHENKNSLSKMGLVGKVKTLTETKYKAVDAAGEIRKGDTISKYITLFNEKGNTVEISVQESHKPLKKYIDKYDNKGNMIEEDTYNSEGKLQGKSTYKYDDKGKNIENSVYDSISRLLNRYTSKFDKKGEMIERYVYNSDTISYVYKDIFKYDEYGNRIEYITYNPDNSLFSKDINKFDDDGNCIELSTYDPDGSLFSKESYKYNENRNTTENISYSYSKTRDVLVSKTTYKYKYDKTGNWIKVTEFEDGIAKDITEREITYY
jgi:hypothetical protein